MKKLFLFTAMLVASALGSDMFAQLDATKTYTIANNNDATKFMQDNGTGVVAIGGKNDNSYWKFVATSNADCYYIQNAQTGKYIQGYTASEQEVVTGDAGVEYYVKADADGSLSGKYRMSCTANSPHDFSDGSGTLGLNWKNNNTVQSFASIVGGNPRSAWIVTEEAMPEPITYPDSPFQGNAVANGDEWYLYNAETGMWLGNNNRVWGSWTTRAQANEVGLDWKIEAIDGGWRLDPKYGKNNSMNSSNFYLDTQDAVTAWTFDEVSYPGATKAYKIHVGNKYLGVVEQNEVGNVLDYDGNTQGTWILVTREQRMAIASEDNPIDASFLIPCYDMGDNNPRYAWSFSTNGDKSGPKVMWEHNRVWETWNVTEMDAYTNCTNIPNGKYLVYAIGAYVPTGGSGMNANDYHNFLNSGSETVHALAYANDKTAKMASIYSETYDSKQDDRWSREIETGVWVADGWGQIANQCGHYNKYWSEPVEVIVADGSLRVGVKMDGQAPSSSWVIFSGMRMKYLGMPEDLLTPALEALNANIAAAEAFNGNTTGALQSALATALAAAKAVTESTNIDEISAASSALFNALNAAQAVDVTVLSATIALAQAEGIDVTAANTVVEEATTVDAVNTALENLRTARRLNAVDKQPDIFTGSAPVDGGQYYLYNIGAQRYLTGGVDYGTHAAVNFAAQVATFTQSGDGWRIHTNIRTGSDAFNHNGFVDCGGDGDTWYLIEVSTGVYNISQTNSNTGANLLGYSGGRRGNWWQVDSDNQGADQAINQWKLVTKEERDALMANASPTNPIDATYYIHAAGLDHYLPDAQMAFPLTSWQTWFPEGKGGNNGIGGWEPDFNWESWNSGNIKFYQELTGLTPGKYRLTAQAYYRHGNFDEAVSEFNNPKTDGAILYATNGNGVTAQSYIVPITSEVDKVPGYGRNSSVGSFPDDRNETAAQFFEVGLYKNVVNDIIVGADGNLTIGVEKFENNKAGEWVVADNFRLTYLGVDDVVVGEAGYTTFVAPYNIDAMPEGVEAYACQVNANSVHLEPVTAIPAGEAVVLKNAGTYTFRPATSEVELGVENDLLPSDGTVTGAAGNIYALAKKTNGVGFYPVKSNVTIPAGKGYLVIGSGSSNVKSFYGFDEDDATGIMAPDVASEEAIYNVAGQRMNKKQKGINIVNGKKILR